MSDETPEPEVDTGGDARMTRATNLLNAANLAARLGRAGVEKFARTRLQRYLNRTGIDESSLQGEDFGSGNFDLGAANATRSVFRNAALKQGRTPGRPGAFGAQVNTLLGQNVETENRAAWDEAQPTFDRIGQQLDTMASTPTFSNEYVANAQSRIASQIQGAKGERLRSVGATLGMRGVDPSTPGGAAIAARAALDADAELASALGDFGMKIEDIERSSQGRELAMQADFTARRLALEAGMKNPAFLVNLNSELSTLMEALRVQSEAEALMADLERDQRGRDRFTNRINDISSVVKLGSNIYSAGSGMGAW